MMDESNPYDGPRSDLSPSDPDYQPPHRKRSIGWFVGLMVGPLSGVRFWQARIGPVGYLWWTGKGGETFLTPLGRTVFVNVSVSGAIVGTLCGLVFDAKYRPNNRVITVPEGPSGLKKSTHPTPDRVLASRDRVRFPVWYLIFPMALSLLFAQILFPARGYARYAGRLAQCRYNLEQSYAAIMSQAEGGAFPERESVQRLLSESHAYCSIARAKHAQSHPYYTYAASRLPYNDQTKGRILLLHDGYGNHTLSKEQRSEVYGDNTPDRTDFIYAVFADGRIEQIYADSEHHLMEICLKKGWIYKND